MNQEPEAPLPLFADFLREWQKSKNLSDIAVAEMVKVTAPTIQEWLRGGPPNRRYWSAIRNATGYEMQLYNYQQLYWRVAEANPDLLDSPQFQRAASREGLRQIIADYAANGISTDMVARSLDLATSAKTTIAGFIRGEALGDEQIITALLRFLPKLEQAAAGKRIAPYMPSLFFTTFLHQYARGREEEAAHTVGFSHVERLREIMNSNDPHRAIKYANRIAIANWLLDQATPKPGVAAIRYHPVTGREIDVAEFRKLPKDVRTNPSVQNAPLRVRQPETRRVRVRPSETRRVLLNIRPVPAVQPATQPTTHTPPPPLPERPVSQPQPTRPDILALVSYIGSVTAALRFISEQKDSAAKNALSGAVGELYRAMLAFEGVDPGELHRILQANQDTFGHPRGAMRPADMSGKER